ncbi:Oidioi.mRNA.OKI2018_I69.XSR.g13794.t1.cds [Oikopleura dioica]|uniref:Oidioi.mRNA.OKI2018_I69.XSR.g13794.t1.cds n=1 Tax=Oikopleura dioica TaxID=34765 RepID=A0ABN7S7X5_OIKDI|nr:Oidioi.mRNA.OKI2018_I69.XSR.g13794.t1.cds [Oikopleura dioica]
MYVVVMVGLPGSGKSTFAKQLSQASNFKLFELDQVFENDPYNEKINRQYVFDQIESQFEQFSKNNKEFGCIVDDLGHLRSIRRFWFNLVCEHQDRRIMQGQYNIYEHDSD